MIRLSQAELFELSLIGKQVIIHTLSGENYEGFFTQISNDEIVLQDMITHLDIVVDANAIISVSMLNDDSARLIDQKVIWTFRNEINKIAEKAIPTIAHIYVKEIEEIMSRCQDNFLKEYFNKELLGRAAKINSIASLEYWNLLFREKELMEDETLFSLAKSLLLFRMRRYTDLMKGYLADIYNQYESDVMLEIALFYSQMKDSRGFAYWMTRYLTSTDNRSLFYDNIWFLYLRTLVQYASFEDLEPILLKLAEFDGALALKSLAYVLSVSCSTALAKIVYNEAIQDISIRSAEQCIYTYSKFLLSGTDTNFRRYKRNLEWLLSNASINDITNRESGKMLGLVYDYIPERQWGFILGYDLLSYFFIEKAIDAQHVKDEINSNICSLISVEEEDHIIVAFDKVEDAKRRYSAANII